MSTAPMTRDQAAFAVQREASVIPFFQKLASHGYEPVNEEEADLLYRLGQRLLAEKQQETVKQASGRISFLKTALAELDGKAPESQPATRDLEYAKSAAAYLAANPQMQQAVSALQSA